MRCKLLESQIYIGTTGQYRLCCVSTEPNNLETVYAHTPVQWLNSDTVKKARDTLANDQWPDACRRCKEEEQMGLPSRRTTKDYLGPGITHLDLRLGNSCNLKCISCWPSSSSSIAHEVQEMSSRGIVPIYNTGVSNHNWYDDKFIDYFKDLPLQEVYLTGGEPMMVNKLDTLLSKLDTNVALRFNTNATIHNPKLFNTISKFKSVTINVSIDAIGRKNHYIRYGSNWNDIENNVKRFMDMSFVEINPCVSVLNAIYYDEILDWADTLNLPVKENLLLNPEWLHIKNAPKTLKEKIKYFDAWKDQESNPAQIKLFVNNISKLDLFRNVRIRDHLPEVAAAYGL